MPLILEFLVVVAFAAITSVVTSLVMDNWHNRHHDAAATAGAPSIQEVKDAVDTALATSARACRVADRSRN